MASLLLGSAAGAAAAAAQAAADTAGTKRSSAWTVQTECSSTSVTSAEVKTPSLRPSANATDDR